MSHTHFADGLREGTQRIAVGCVRPAGADDTPRHVLLTAIHLSGVTFCIRPWRRSWIAKPVKRLLTDWSTRSNSERFSVFTSRLSLCYDFKGHQVVLHTKRRYGSFLGGTRTDREGKYFNVQLAQLGNCCFPRRKWHEVEYEHSYTETNRLLTAGKELHSHLAPFRVWLLVVV